MFSHVFRPAAFMKSYFCRKTLILFTALFFCCVALCAIAEEKREIRIGIIDSFNQGFVYDTLEPTLEHLSRRLPKYRFTVVELNSVNPKEDLHARPVDFFVSSAGTFHELSISTGAMHIATRKSVFSDDPSASEGSVFLVLRSRNDLNSLSDLKNKTVAASQPNSFDGWLIALHEIYKRGYEPEKFFRKAVYSHFQFPDVLMQLEKHNADVAILSACLLEELTAEGLVDASEYKVLEEKPKTTLKCAHSTDLYPGIVFAASESTPANVAWEVTSALINMGSVNEYEWTIASRFSKVNELYRDLRLGPYAHLRDWTFEGLIKRFGTYLFVVSLLLCALLGNWFYLRRTVARRTLQVRRTLERQLELEKEKREADSRLSQLEKFGVISQMSGMLAHEVQQPLVAINNYLAGLKFYMRKKNWTDPMTEKAIVSLENNSTRIGNIITRVRGYAKHKRGQLRRCDLVEIAKSALGVMSAGQFRSIPIRFNAPQNAFVMGEPLELELLMINLMRNACSACENSVPPEVSLSIEAHDSDCYVVTVTDNGPRLGDEAFNRLMTLGDSVKSNGMGIGLSLVRGIADSHGGTIQFERLPERGIRAIFRIEKDEENEQ